MIPPFVALAGSLWLVVLAAAWVKPVPLGPTRRPRALDLHDRQPRRAPGCPSWFETAARRAALPEPVGRWWTASTATVIVVGAVGGLLGGPVFALMVASALVGGLVLALRLSDGRADARLARSVPDSLDAIARSARSGASVVQALAALDGPDASSSDRAFVEVARRVERGESLADSLDRLVSVHPLPAVRLAAAALAVGHEAGAPPARAVDGVASTLRDRAALDREARAHASQATASAVVLVVAPIVFSLFTIAADPRVGDFLFRTWLGWVCLGVGVGLEVAGGLWMRAILRAAR